MRHGDHRRRASPCWFGPQANCGTKNRTLDVRFSVLLASSIRGKMGQMSQQNESDVRSPVLRLRGEAKAFPSSNGTIRVLDDEDFELEPGDFVTACEPSGVGTSSLLQIAADPEKPSAEAVEVLGKSDAAIDTPAARRAGRSIASRARPLGPAPWCHQRLASAAPCRNLHYRSSSTIESSIGIQIPVDH